MKTRKSRALAPCPFCGEKPNWLKEPDVMDGTVFGVICINKDCYVNPKVSGWARKANALYAWNTKKVSSVSG